MKLNAEKALFDSKQMEKVDKIRFKIHPSGKVVAYNFEVAGKVNQRFEVCVRGYMLNGILYNENHQHNVP